MMDIKSFFHDKHEKKKEKTPKNMKKTCAQLLPGVLGDIGFCLPAWAPQWAAARGAELIRAELPGGLQGEGGGFLFFWQTAESAEAGESFINALKM